MTVKAYATELVTHLSTIAGEQEAIKDLVNSAKDAGINPRMLRKVAREMILDSDKRAKLYEDEEQLWSWDMAKEVIEAQVAKPK